MATANPAQMRAIQQQAWGGPEQLRLVTVERPVPLPTEILVRVVAASVNPVDVFTREGRAYMRALSLPHIPGWDVSGIVEQVGYGVTRFRVGDAVFGMPWFPRQAGAYAEYVTAPARQFASKPQKLSHVEAAALPLAGLTAWEMLHDIAKVSRGQRVLISAGAGGVGHLAVQIAKHLGAHVIATARSEKHDFLRMLGADEVHDYTAADPAETFRNIDVVIELVGGETCVRLLKTLRPGGLLISAQAAWAPQLFAEAERLQVHASAYLVEPNSDGLRDLARLVEEGRLRPYIHRTFPLAEAQDAQSVVASGRTLGKVVLTCGT